MTCPICHNAHSGECSVAALKARIRVLSKDPETIPRHLLIALRHLQLAFEQCDSSSLGTINENLQPIADAAMGWISSLRRDREEAWKERDTLRAQLADRQRLLDLVRHQRGPLHDAGLISDEEYAALAGDHGAVARLEGYDEARAKLAEAKATIARLNRSAH